VNGVDVLSDLARGDHRVDTGQTKAASALHPPEGGSRCEELRSGEKVNGLHRRGGLEVVTLVELDVKVGKCAAPAVLRQFDRGSRIMGISRDVSRYDFGRWRNSALVREMMVWVRVRGVGMKGVERKKVMVWVRGCWGVGGGCLLPAAGALVEEVDR